MIDTIIAHYKILEKLGEGGMGVVYKAQDTRLDRLVALKFLPREVAADAPERARFIQEAKAASALNHPNVCVIHDLAEHENQQFIVMEYVDGVTLRQKLTEGTLGLKDVIEYALQIADAIQAAHEKEITHRDIKSDNVMVTAKGQIKVMDFGLAKLKGALQLTKSTSTVGTLAYMAPEQLQGKDTDSRMDIFSFGVVLYEMLTGKLPFQAEYEAALMYSVVNTEPEPATKYRPELSSEMLHLLNRALEKDPDDRYLHIQDLIVDLRRSKRDTSKVIQRPSADMLRSREVETSAESHVNPERKRSSMYIGLAAAVIIIVAVGIWLWRGERKTPVPQFANPTRVTTAIGVEDYPTWSPDGTMVAYQSNQSGNTDIWVTQVPGGSSRNLTEDHVGIDRFPSWSPDGRHIAFWSSREGGGVYLMSALGGSIRKVFTYSFSAPQWSMDGLQIACNLGDSAAIIDVEKMTSQHVTLTTPRLGARELSWSSDKRFFAYVDRAGRIWPASRIWIQRIEDEEGIPITSGITWDQSPFWSADGETLYFISNRGGSKDLWQQQIGDDGYPVGEASAITAGLDIQFATMSTDGTRLAFQRGRQVRNIWRIPHLKDRRVTWNDAQQLTFEQADFSTLDLSRDGKHLVYRLDREERPYLYILPVDGGEMRQITKDPMTDAWPQWSPDGREIAFHGLWAGNRDIWVAPVDGGSPRQGTQDSTSQESEPTWSPDGDEIAYSRFIDGNSSIWIIPSDGGKSRKITPNGIIAAFSDWSPDGQWLLYTGVSGRDFQLWKIPAEGGESELLVERSSMAGKWSLDGKTILYTRAGNLWEYDVEEKLERQLTDFTGKRGSFGMGRVVSDGEFIYFNWGENTGDLWVMDVEWE